MLMLIFDRVRTVLIRLPGIQHTRYKFPGTWETGLAYSRSLNSQSYLCLHKGMTRCFGSPAGRLRHIIASIDGWLGFA